MGVMAALRMARSASSSEFSIASSTASDASSYPHDANGVTGKRSAGSLAASDFLVTLASEPTTRLTARAARVTSDVPGDGVGSAMGGARGVGEKHAPGASPRAGQV